MQLTGLYNINLALQLHRRNTRLDDVVVRNDAQFDDSGRIYILTGPNQGGKTTYTQAIGLAYLLMQAGLHIPAESATLSAIDGIYTHFATEERPEHEAGRLGEEARRLSSIFEKATRYSLVLLNESLASTAADESLFIARDVVRVLRKLGARAVYATHLHNLAEDCDLMNDQTEGDSRIISVVSQVEHKQDTDGQAVHRTYKIKPGPPASRSYAVELAARYGISYEQLTDVLRHRKVVD
jgi:DNA mismatch repair ATPase MutS